MGSNSFHTIVSRIIPKQEFTYIGNQKRLDQLETANKIAKYAMSVAWGKYIKELKNESI